MSSDKEMLVAAFLEASDLTSCVYRESSGMSKQLHATKEEHKILDVFLVPLCFTHYLKIIFAHLKSGLHFLHCFLTLLLADRTIQIWLTNRICGNAPNLSQNDYLPSDKH